MMGAKQMRIINQSETKVTLRGFGVDNFGESFADYGLTIFIKFYILFFA